MRKLLLGLSIVALIFAQDMVIAGSGDAESESVGTKVGKKVDKVKEGVEKVAKKAKEGAKKVANKVKEGAGKLKRKVTGKLTDEEREEEREKKKEKAKKSLSKTQEKELENQKKQLTKQMQEAFKDAEKIQENVENARKKVRDAGECKEDQMPGTVEDFRRNARLEATMSQLSTLGMTLKDTLYHLKIAERAKDEQKKEEEKAQVALKMSDFRHMVSEFARSAANFCAIMESSSEKGMYNEEGILKAFENLKSEGGKISSDYDKLKTLAEDTGNEYVLELLGIVKPVFETCAVVCTECVKELTRLVKNPSKGTEGFSTAVKEAMSAAGIEEVKWDTMFEEAEKELSETSGTSSEGEKTEEENGAAEEDKEEKTEE